MSAPSLSAVDAAIDESDDGIAERLADMLDDRGWWDWSDGAEHDPSDRFAVVESTGAWWLVYRGTEPDSAERFGREDQARAALRTATEQIGGAS